MIFCSSRPRRTIRRIRGRAVKALRSGRSQLCWRGFESHRMQHLFCVFLSVPCFPSDSVAFVVCTHISVVGAPTVLHWSLNNMMQDPCNMAERSAHTNSCLGRASHPKPTKKGYGGTGIRARVKRITTAYANHYTIPPR
jgi:hypothetical protein